MLTLMFTLVFLLGLAIGIVSRRGVAAFFDHQRARDGEITALKVARAALTEELLGERAKCRRAASHELEVRALNAKLRDRVDDLTDRMLNQAGVPLGWKDDGEEPLTVAQADRASVEAEKDQPRSPAAFRRAGREPVTVRDEDATPAIRLDSSDDEVDEDEDTSFASRMSD